MPLRFIVLGDVHVGTSGHASEATLHIVEQAAQRRPACVVLCGDATSGNQGDGVPLSRVRRWWQGVHEALGPLRRAGVPVLPIAGNHDFYTAAHRSGYADAWADLASHVAPLRLSGHPPHSYSCDVEGVHLSLVHVIDQAIDAAHAEWLEHDLAAAGAAQARLVFGHVPAQSAMGRTSASFRRRMVGLLTQGRADAYFCGHEHLYWDEVVTDPPEVQGVRQVIVGTPGAAYVFPLKAELYRRHCHGGHGTAPGSGVRFAIDPRTREQALRAVFVEVEAGAGALRVRPLGLDSDGTAIDFDEAEQVRWLRGALNQVAGAGLPDGGDYDEATQEAVRRFQGSAGLAADGVAGPLTRQRLRAALAIA